MPEQYWSWILTAVGVTGFILAGRKIWWSWYVNIACQALWFTYAIVTEQWGFIVGAFVYSAVFINNAMLWTAERFKPPPLPAESGDLRVRFDINADQIREELSKVRIHTRNLENLLEE